MVPRPMVGPHRPVASQRRVLATRCGAASCSLRSCLDLFSLQSSDHRLELLPACRPASVERPLQWPIGAFKSSAFCSAIFGQPPGDENYQLPEQFERDRTNVLYLARAGRSFLSVHGAFFSAITSAFVGQRHDCSQALAVLARFVSIRLSASAFVRAVCWNNPPQSGSADSPVWAPKPAARLVEIDHLADQIGVNLELKFFVVNSTSVHFPRQLAGVVITQVTPD